MQKTLTRPFSPDYNHAPTRQAEAKQELVAILTPPSVFVRRATPHSPQTTRHLWRRIGC